MKEIIIIRLLAIALSLFSTYAIPATIGWLKSAKGKSVELKINKIAEFTNKLIVEYEEKYAVQDKILKSVDPTMSTGSMKKESVITEIFQQCITIGLKYDKDFWSKYINEIVDLTRKVNKRDCDKVVVPPTAPIE